MTTTTITLELNATQCTALLALLHARPAMNGTVEQQLSYKVQNAIRDAERARAFLRNETQSVKPTVKSSERE